MDTLVAKIGAGLIRSFLLAGLLPAAVPVLGWLLYTRGSDFAAKTLSASKLSEFGPLLLGWVVIGLVLFAIRQPLLASFQGRPSGRVGWWFLNRAVRRRSYLARRSDTLAWRYTVARWPVRNFEAGSAEFRPDWIEVPELEVALEAARAARSVIASLPDGWSPQDANESSIMQGLSRLYLIAGSKLQREADATEVGKELESWRHLPASAAALFEGFATIIMRDWNIAQLRLDQFPKGLWLHPTDLGNRLTALDDYAKDRYGIETTTLWTRLWWSLPDASKDDVTDAKLNVEICVNFAAAISLLAIIPFFTGATVCPAWKLLACRAEVPLWTILSVGVAYLAYRGAVAAVTNLSVTMQTLIDMHRLRVLAAFGLRPTNAADEMAFFDELEKFLAQAAQRDQTRSIQIGFDWAADASKAEKSK